MPKNLPPESGHNVKDELDNIRSNPSSYLSHMTQKISAPYEEENLEVKSDFDAVEQTATELMYRINPDTCCGARQYSVFLDDLFRLIKMRSNVMKSTHIPHAGKKGESPDYTDAKDLWGKYKLALSAMVSEINSFRLACLNCLNNDCKKRNPKSPVTDVQQRAKKIIMP